MGYNLRSMIERSLEIVSELRSQKVDFLPQNQRFLKALMLSYARRNPNLEFGGFILTDQGSHSLLSCVSVGDERSVIMPWSLDGWDFDTYNTLVQFHSHPVGSKVAFSFTDMRNFNNIVRRYHEGFVQLLEEGDLNLQDKYIYDAVLDARGRIMWSGFSLSANKEGVANVFPITRVTIDIPENWEITEVA